MAFNYSANQFEQQFLPKSLCNWEVPKYNPRAYPKQKTKTTRIIANDRGHLLPGIGKASKTNGCLSEVGKNSAAAAWTNYRGTWNLPEKILTKQEAFELNGLALQTPFSGPRWKRSSQQQKQLNRKRSQNNLKDKQLKLLTHATNNPEQDLSYVPGEVVEPELKLERLKLNGELVDEENQNCNLYLEEHNCADVALIAKEIEASNLIHDTIKSGQGDVNNLDAMMKYNIPDKPTEKEEYMPYIPAYCNFETARRMAQDNLGHQPLPDAVVDTAFRKMQATNGGQYPGLALDIMPVATGFGVRNTKAGPTQCTKMMRIYRPKTCGIMPKPVSDKYSQDRPQSSICEKKMGPMDLAICWDYRPFDPRDEPKPPVHIDGSNDSAGPAVFTLVKTPREPENIQATGRSTGALFSNTLGEENFFFDKDLLKRDREYNEKYSMDRKCECGNQEQQPQRTTTSQRHSAGSHQQSQDHRLRSSSSHRPKTTSRVQQSHQNLQKSFHKSSPNLLVEMANGSSSDDNGGPDACHLVCIKHDAVDVNGNKLQRFKSQPELNYNTKRRISRPCNKTAPAYPSSAQKQHSHCKSDLPPFKAGIPNRNSNSFDSGCSSMSDSQPKQPVRVPKPPRDPYGHKNYNIDTLAPPFTCWKGGSGQGSYPVFLRLASVYQHSYKPIDQRRRPLLATVYK